ncbi:hypothetical protein Anas_00236 [Armadillidium nasatum]|uniref:Ig-like domain-containing protein n=1 Tax=Armadillidium nasatum TaxID=96803 RepID=A0A5N5TPH2_9CRUS|nr:hypothetical protein Anas_00236 [Armadillidium nasatum]
MCLSSLWAKLCQQLVSNVVYQLHTNDFRKSIPFIILMSNHLASDNATFVCEVEHSSQYYVTWLKDNKVLDDKLADRIIQQDEGKKHTLKLLHCKVEDSAIYTAKATDNNGVSATCSAQFDP